MKPALSQEFLQWVVQQNAKLEKLDRLGAAEREQIFWQVAKLTEETGELAEAVMAMEGLQRAEKTPPDTKDAAALEVADVIITTLLLANRLGVDVNNALERKIEKIDRRFAEVNVKQ